MDIWSEKNGKSAVIYVRGDIDEHSAAEIRAYADSIIALGISSLEFCLQYVDFMDSTGIGMLLGRYKKLKKTQGSLYVSGVNSQIDKIFRLSGIYTVVPLVR